MAGGRLGRAHRGTRSRIPQQPLDRRQFDGVGHGRGAVGIDVINLSRLQTRPRQSGSHRPERPVAILCRGGDVMGVARHAVAQHLGVNLRPPRQRMVQRLQHHNPGPFAHHEPVAVGVIGAAGLGRIIGAPGRKRLAGVEPGDADLGYRAFGSPGHHHIGVAPLDQPGGVANRVGTGRTGGNHRMVRPLEAEPDRHLPRNQVDQRAGDKER